VSVLRDLHGITYWVIEDPLEIARLVNSHIRKEWESDIAEQEDHEGSAWLKSLQNRKWLLARVRLDRIKLNREVMDYVDGKTGYNFRMRLEERKRLLNQDLDKFGAVIRPIVLRAEDNLLMDGYCRYHVLLDRGVKEAYAYIGSL
jgi:hypothetical protein